MRKIHNFYFKFIKKNRNLLEKKTRSLLNKNVKLVFSPIHTKMAKKN